MYSSSTFGETLAALLILLFLVECAKPEAKASRILLYFVLAGFSKETAFPFLALLGFAVCPDPRRLKILAGGMIASILLAIAFNEIRFGVPYNRTLMAPEFRVHELSLQFNFFSGLWLSPSGGLFLYWPSFVAILLLGTAVALQSVPARHFRLALLWLSLAGLTLGFSMWWSPFGWYAWGPRLLLPWIPGALFVVLINWGGRIDLFLKRLLASRRGFWTALLAVLLVSLPQFVVLFDAGFLSYLFGPTPACRANVTVQGDSTAYYQCLLSYVWPEQWRVLRLFRDVFSPPVLICSLLYAGVIYVLFDKIRASAPESAKKTP